MIIKTRVFDLTEAACQSLPELARVMGISVSQVYRVKDGKRNINQKFIIGAIRVFPERRLDDLFYFYPSPKGIGSNIEHREAQYA